MGFQPGYNTEVGRGRSAQAAEKDGILLSIVNAISHSAPAGPPNPDADTRAPGNATAPASSEVPPLTEAGLEDFLQGRDVCVHDKLGAHLTCMDGRPGVRFAVWAPNAAQVQLLGDFNDWNKGANQLQSVGSSGVWTGFVPQVEPGMRYKYHVISRFNGHVMDKIDPFAVRSEVPPLTASIVWDLNYQWADGEWMKQRGQANSNEAPISIYEVHLGSWRRVPEEGNRSLTYRELAPQLAEYVRQMGFTHVELLPILEHPFYGSWGYQTTGYFAPTSRYGTPQDLMYFVDYLHQQGIGVILDWVPSHFPWDQHGLGFFDGTHLFEHADPRRGYHPRWKSALFNYGRNEVRSFLASSALFWLEKYHMDGLRVDAVATMLYLDFERKPGMWLPNRHGGRENLEAVEFLRQLNREVAERHPDVLTIAEDSTSWPNVSRPASEGGLGFRMKWDMGWMHDTLDYFKLDPIHRKQHHGELAFRIVYAFSENFVLPLSHDEVVHCKHSLYGRMPGDPWKKYANLRLLFGYMFAQPGKKLLFMGGELAQWPEWNHEASIDWHALQDPLHAGVQQWVTDLNRLYRAEPALHALDFKPEGFEWIDFQDAKNTTLSFIRKAPGDTDVILAVFNFTPVLRTDYRVGVPRGGFWQELLNGDATCYGGSGQGNVGGLNADSTPCHGRPWSVRMTLPPLAAVFFSSRAQLELNATTPMGR
jgi:1,4-alpha-glucan branching enzyme